MTERDAFVDAIRCWMVGAAAVAPTLLVIDDLHWATSSTRDVLRDLTRRAGHDRLLVVATTRDRAPDVSVELTALLADLQRSPATTTVRLGGLDPDESPPSWT